MYFSLCSGVSRGLDVDKFAPRLSFFWGIGMNFYLVCFWFLSGLFLLYLSLINEWQEILFCIYLHVYIYILDYYSTYWI